MTNSIITNNINTFTKAFKLSQKGKEFTAICNNSWCQVTISTQEGIPTGTSFPVESLKDFEIVSEYNIGEL